MVYCRSPLLCSKKYLRHLQKWVPQSMTPHEANLFEMLLELEGYIAVNESHLWDEQNIVMCIPFPPFHSPISSSLIPPLFLSHCFTLSFHHLPSTFVPLSVKPRHWMLNTAFLRTFLRFPRTIFFLHCCCTSRCSLIFLVPISNPPFSSLPLRFTCVYASALLHHYVYFFLFLFPGGICSSKK